jgi:hypothetical protein
MTCDFSSDKTRRREVFSPPEVGLLRSYETFVRPVFHNKVRVADQLRGDRSPTDGRLWFVRRPTIAGHGSVEISHLARLVPLPKLMQESEARMIHWTTT